MKIDLTCPAEIWRMSLPTEEQPICEVLLRNLSDRTIVSAEVTVIGLDENGEETEHASFRTRDLDGRSGTAFSVGVPMKEPAKIHQTEALVEKLWFADSSVWRRGRYPMTDYTPNALPVGRKLEDLRFVAGQDAVGYPSDQGECWLCVCGRPNPGYMDSCARCKRDRKLVFRQYNENAVDQAMDLKRQQLELKTRAARENSSKMQLEREQVWADRRRKKRRILTGALCAVAAVGLTLAGVFWAAPQIRYRSAVSAMESGDYAAAEQRFLAMGDYQDAAANAVKCRYLGAAAAAETGNEDEVRAARETLLALGDYEDAASLAEKAEYRLAQLVLTDGRAAEAKSMLTGMPATPETAELIREADYQLALAELEAGSWEQAGADFAALGDYRDAASQVKEAVYRPAVEALQNGDPFAAADMLERIAGYRDADELLPQAYYLQGDSLAKGGDLVSAGRAYLKAGDWGDAPDKAAEYLYPAASQAFEAGNWASAAELFALIPAYQDSSEKYRTAAYARAEQAMKDGEYQVAGELLATLPDDFEETLDLRQEAAYQSSMSALEAGEWEKAIEGFSRISTYRDSMERLREARYWMASQKTEEGDWLGAIQLYEQTGTYGDTAKNLRTVRYAYAEQLMAGERWEEAAAIYAQLGTYSDAAEKRQAAVYAQAVKLEAAEDWAGAQTLYAGISGYSDADARAAACAYRRAGTLEADGDLQAAADMYASIPEFEDAKAKADGLYLQLGQAAEESGQLLAAARLYAKAGEAGATKAAACYDAYYGTLSQDAVKAAENGEWQLVVTLLNHTDLSSLPEKYGNLDDIWQEANYGLAVGLYEKGDVYGALPYLQAVPGYQDADRMLQRSCYRILGEWQTRDGKVYVFSPDGTCSMDGERLAFSVPKNNELWTGKDADSLKRTHTISSVTDSRMNLRIIGSRTLILNRTGDAPDTVAESALEADAAGNTETEKTAETASPTDFLVVDEDD